MKLLLTVAAVAALTAQGVYAKSAPHVYYDINEDSLFYKVGKNVTTINTSGTVGATGAQGDQGATGAQGSTGAQGDQGDRGDRGDRGMSSLSLTAALASFNNSGFGIGIAGTHNNYQVSLGAGIMFKEQGRFIMGLTYEPNTGTAIGSIGLGWNF